MISSPVKNKKFKIKGKRQKKQSALNTSGNEKIRQFLKDTIPEGLQKTGNKRISDLHPLKKMPIYNLFTSLRPLNNCLKKIKT